MAEYDEWANDLTAEWLAEQLEVQESSMRATAAVLEAQAQREAAYYAGQTAPCRRQERKVGPAGWWWRPCGTCGEPAAGPLRTRGRATRRHQQAAHAGSSATGPEARQAAGAAAEAASRATRASSCRASAAVAVLVDCQEAQAGVQAWPAHAQCLCRRQAAAGASSSWRGDGSHPKAAGRMKSKEGAVP